MSSLRTIRSSAFSDVMNVPQLLTHELGQHVRPELAICAPEPPSIGLTSDDDKRPLWGERAAEA